MATLGELRTRILAKLAEGGGYVAAPTAAQVNDQINSTISLYSSDTWWFTEAIETGLCVVGDPILPVPEDFGAFLEPNGVVVQQNNVRYPVMKITPLQYDTIYVGSGVSLDPLSLGATGLPRFYTYRDQRIELYYPPNFEYTYYIYYKKLYADLTTDDESNDFTNFCTRLIEYQTLADCYRDYRSDAEMAAIYDAKVKTEYLSIAQQSYERTATGNLTTENVTGRSRTTLYER